MRFRFEKAYQMIPLRPADIAILPLAEALKVDLKENIWVELPSLIYPGDEEKIKSDLKALALKCDFTINVVCENIGAIEIANELGFTPHGGMFLNILNSDALNVYKDLGLVDATMSIELSFNEARKIKSELPYGFVIYGFMPLMKFRTCPGDCLSCNGRSTITDRLGNEFTLMCRDKKYSELLNYLPTYVGDRLIPSCEFKTLYFTKESKEEIIRIKDLVLAQAEFPGKKTAGLYFRELL